MDHEVSRRARSDPDRPHRVSGHLVGYRLTHANSDDPWIGPLTSVKLLVAWTMYGLFVALGLIDEIGMSEPTAELARETSIWDLKDILG